MDKIKLSDEVAVAQAELDIKVAKKEAELAKFDSELKIKGLERVKKEAELKRDVDSAQADLDKKTEALNSFDNPVKVEEK